MLKEKEKQLRDAGKIKGDVAWRLLDELEGAEPVLVDKKPVIVGDVQLIQK